MLSLLDVRLTWGLLGAVERRGGAFEGGQSLCLSPTISEFVEMA
jgi:hypothetical protein